MIIDYIEFSNKINGDLQKFQKELEDIRIQLKKISEYAYDNNIARFSNIYGTEFSFLISEKSKWDNKNRKFIKLGIFELFIWDYIGSTSIFHSIIPQENRNEFIREILNICEEWSKGKKKCSDCGKWISYLENQNHRYFAGIYCDDCWNRKWKAIEKAESYE